MFGFDFDVADPVAEAAGRPLDAATMALAARMAAPPTADRLQVIDALVTALKAAGVWAKLDVLQVFAAHGSQAALLNWKGTSFTASATGGAPVFVPDRGFFCNGIADVLDLGCAPSGLAQFAQNNAEFGGWMRTPAGVSRANSILGTLTASGCTLNPRNTSNAVGARINGATADTSLASASFHGLTSVARIGATQIVSGRNGSRGTPQSATSATRSAVNFGFGKCNNGFAEGQISAFFAGAALSDAEELALHDALAAYMAAVGVAALTPTTRTIASSGGGTLPNGSAPPVAAKGMACTGLARRADGRWYVGNGLDPLRLNALCCTRVSADFLTIEREFTTADLALGTPPAGGWTGSVQGLCVDAAEGNLMWAVLKIANAQNTTYLFGFDMSSETIVQAPVALPTTSCNGVADDGVAGKLLIAREASSGARDVIRVDKATGANTGVFALQAPADADMLFHMAGAGGGDLLLTAGTNGDDGTISVMRRDDYGAYCARRIDTLTGSTAIEGVVVADGIYYVCNDGATHPDAIGTNRIMTYPI